MLITSVGGLVGTYLAKQLSRDGQYYLVGADMAGMVPQRERLSAFYQTVDASADMQGEF